MRGSATLECGPHVAGGQRPAWVVSTAAILEVDPPAAFSNETPTRNAADAVSLLAMDVRCFDTESNPTFLKREALTGPLLDASFERGG